MHKNTSYSYMTNTLGRLLYIFEVKLRETMQQQCVVGKCIQFHLAKLAREG